MVAVWETLPDHVAGTLITGLAALERGDRVPF
jgi:hypothetical protein